MALAFQIVADPGRDRILLNILSSAALRGLLFKDIILFLGNLMLKEFPGLYKVTLFAPLQHVLFGVTVTVCVLAGQSRAAEGLIVFWW